MPPASATYKWHTRRGFDEPECEDLPFEAKAHDGAGLRPGGDGDVRGGERPGGGGLGHTEAASHLLRPAGPEDDLDLL